MLATEWPPERAAEARVPLNSASTGRAPRLAANISVCLPAFAGGCRLRHRQQVPDQRSNSGGAHLQSHAESYRGGFALRVVLSAVRASARRDRMGEAGRAIAHSKGMRLSIPLPPGVEQADATICNNPPCHGAQLNQLIDYYRPRFGLSGMARTWALTLCRDSLWLFERFVPETCPCMHRCASLSRQLPYVP